MTFQPNGTGWYCFLDQYSGDSNYKPVSDNNTATECVDVTAPPATSNAEKQVRATGCPSGPHLGAGPSGGRVTPPSTCVMAPSRPTLVTPEE